MRTTRHMESEFRVTKHAKLTGFEIKTLSMVTQTRKQRAASRSHEV